MRLGAAPSTALRGRSGRQAGLLTGEAFAKSNSIAEGDVAILRFVAAAELIESDLWLQYAELGGASGGNPAYVPGRWAG